MKLHTLLALTVTLASLHADPPPPVGKTTPMFDGKTLAGWEGNAKIWRVEEGVITGGSLTETVKENDFLATTRDYGDFIVRFKIKLTGTGFVNSGFQIRSQRVPNNSEMAGYQCDYGEPGWYGAIYDESRRNKLMAPSDMEALRPVIKLNDWNEYIIRADGRRIQTWINGVQGVDYTEADAAIVQTGKSGIQVHGGGKALVQVKDLTIEELPPTEKIIGAPEPAKAAKVSPLSPDDERASFTMPPGFEIELVASEDIANGIGKFVPIAFDQKGALWTTTALEYPVDGNENPAAADALYASKAKDKVLVFDTPLASGVQKPRVFAEGLAIPLGVLAYKNGCYVQHGHDIAFLEDTDGDGRADKRTVILTGFGVQDSHLFPHQFMRAPGGWIWMAQGAFNYSKVQRPGEPPEKAVKFDQTRMAKFRPDGTGFEITSNGPCNIWGLVLDGEGQAWIQEANDFGYPVMAFHEYANYPGCSDSQWKSYAPEFPGTPGIPMGGTGLSGLALSDKWIGESAQSSVLSAQTSGADANREKLSTEHSALSTFPRAYCDVMYVANPITRKIQAIKIIPDGPRFSYRLLGDFIQSGDEWFRPIAITFGPDGCLYIVDWYNKIISHNEVARNHPDRDKTRGRIWRVKATGQQPFPMQDFTKATGDELLAKLGGPSLAQSHLAWQAIGDRSDSLLSDDLEKKITAIVKDTSQPAARRIQSLWAMKEMRPGNIWIMDFPELASDPNRNVRRELVRMDQDTGYTSLEEAFELSGMLEDADTEVRAQLIRTVGNRITPQASESIDAMFFGIGFLLTFAAEPLEAPTAPATRNGKPIKVREAYDRAYERYLVRMFLERHPEAVAKFLDVTATKTLGELAKTSDPINTKKFLPSRAARELPLEARLLASLALEPKASASRVAQLLPKLTRPPGQEEVLRLVQFLDEPGVGDAVKAALGNPATSAAVLESLLAVRTKLDAAKLTPLLAEAAATLLASKDATALDLGVKLAAGFKLATAEDALAAIVQNAAVKTVSLSALRALGEIGSAKTDLFAKLAESAPDATVRDAALTALASSKAADAPARTLALYPKLAPTPRRLALDKLSATKPGAAAIVAAIDAKTIAPADLDAATFDRLQAVLGPNDPALARVLTSLAALFRPVLTLNGKEDAFAETGLTIEGPCTIETWVRLAPGIGNADGILYAKDTLDMNFYDSKFRVWVGGTIHDAIVSTKPIAPDLWTHVAATRDAAGKWKLYINGELDTADSKLAPQKIENPRIGATGAPGGTEGAFAEYRIWNRERTAGEIRDNFDRSLVAATAPSQVVLAASSPRDGLVFHATGETGWGKLGAGAKIAKTNDFPPILTPDESIALDVKFSKYRALAAQPGDAARGKATAALCQACHLMGPTGGNIGPNLSGVGAMGTEAILRNILTPNAAMENGYRIYRVELKNGDLVEAFFVSEDKDAVIVRLPGAADRRIAKSEIARTQYLRRSLMPEGLLDALPPEQVSDLFAFLRTLK